MICSFRKSFRVTVHQILPFGKKPQREDDQTPAIIAFNENQWSKHHGKIPVVNTTGAAASVFHEPGLEWTEEQNADHVADSVCKTDEDHDTFIENLVIE